MRLVFISILLLTVVAVRGQMSHPQPYILALPSDCDVASLSIVYQLRGTFGGISELVRTQANKREFEIPTSHDGIMASELRLSVSSQRYKTLIFILPTPSEKGGRIEAKLEKQAFVEFRGKISSNESITDDWMELSVDFLPFWKCGFSGGPDCFVGAERAASADVAGDGSFKVMLPDFVRDQALSDFKEKGVFRFFLRDRKTGNRVYDLHPSGDLTPFDEVPVSSNYSGTRLFVAKRSN